MLMVEILAEQTIDGFSYNSSVGVFMIAITPSPCVLELDKEYTVKWGTEEHVCTSFLANINGYEMITIGNTLIVGGADTGQTFAIAYNPTTDYLNLFTLEEGVSHNIGIYSVEEETTGVTITLYDRKGKPVTYEGIDRIVVDTPIEDEYAIFTYGEALENSEFEPNFAEGDQLITLEKGQLLKEFTIKKPENLISENIVEGVNIAGVEGTKVFKLVDHSLVDGETFCTLLDDSFDQPPTKIVDYAFYKHPALIGVSMSKVSSIGSYAFADTKLINGRFSSCEYIGDAAFSNCTTLTQIEASKCKYVGASAFRSCKLLESVSFPLCETVGSYAFSYCSSLSYVNIESCTTVGSYAFSGLTKLKEMNLPYCSNIYPNAFMNCIVMSNLSIPECVRISSNAFQFCDALTELIAPKCMYISSHAFRACDKLAVVYLPSLVSMSAYMFNSCSKLQSLYLLRSTMVTPANSNALLSTPIVNSNLTGSFGSIYVRSSLLANYLANASWAIYSSRFVGMTDEEIESLKTELGV